MKATRVRGFLSLLLLGLLAAGCGGGEAGGEGGLTGTISIDGSSTVFPISEAMAEEFQIANPGVRVTVGVSGTGGGFKKFCNAETDVSDASRPIKETEREACQAAGIEFHEIPVAWDGLSVVVNPANGWARCLTTDELRRIWQPGSTIERWSDIRDEFPDRELELYGPDTDSGTFDYFTEAIMGEEDASRSDYTASADDNVLVIGVEGDETALGYFGFAYYRENRERLNALGVDPGSGCVEPTMETIESGAYEPLSRPLFIYVSKPAYRRPEVKAFVEFYLESAPALVPSVGYVPLGADRYRSILDSLPGLEGEGDAAREEAG